MQVDKAAELGVVIPAQTNGMLLQQMHEAGKASEDLRKVQHAYNACLGLFLGLHRGSGRPFLCHLVGTASIVAQIGETTDMIVAALCHSLFDFAVFQDGRTIHTPKNKNRIRDVIGAKAFELVRRYEEFPWGGKVIARLASQPAPDSEPVRNLWVLRLANEIDDMSNCSMALALKHGSSMRDRLVNCAIMARKIDQERLAFTLEHLVDEFEKQKIWTEDLDKGPADSFRLIQNANSYLRMRRVRPHNLKTV